MQKSIEEEDPFELVYSSVINIEESILQNISIDMLRSRSMQTDSQYQNLKNSIHQSNTENQQFYQSVLKLIQKIQPSKLWISKAIDKTTEIKQLYCKVDEKKLQLAQEAQTKNILVINNISPMQDYELFEGIIKCIEQFQKCIMLIQTQLGMVLFIQDNVNKLDSESFTKLYLENYCHLQKFVIDISKTNQPLNHVILNITFKLYSQFLQDLEGKSSFLHHKIQEAQSIFIAKKSIKRELKKQLQFGMKNLQIITSKLTTLAEFFPYACIKSLDDLFSLPSNNPRWQALLSTNTIQYKIYGTSKQIDESFHKLRANLNVINASMNILSQARLAPKGKKYWSQQFYSALKVFKLAISQKKAQHEAQFMIASSTQSLAKQIWNLPQKKQLQKFIALTLPSIQFSKQFFIPRLARSSFFESLKGKQFIMPEYKIDNPFTYIQQLEVEKSPQEKLPIRINSSFELLLRQWQKENVEKGFLEKHLGAIKQKFQSFKNRFKTEYKAPKQVIFHIHGGGFISMSSFIHQSYTRLWSNSLNTPIISVDYGKAPQFPYPEGLYDCLQAYLWVCHVYQQIYQAQPEKIILVGDSAGGNLVAALTNLLIQWKLRKPDGIVLVYPALNLNLQDYTPSFLNALNDMILPHTILKICSRSYLSNQDCHPQTDCFISPVLAQQKILKNYPPTRIFVGSKDPFHDDCVRLTQKINLLNQTKDKKVHLMIFQGFPHGFLQFDMKNQPHTLCRQATKQVQNALAQLILRK